MKNSIVKRWLFTILGTSVFLVVFFSVFVCFFVKHQHYNLVETTLNSRANSLVMTYFNSKLYVVDEMFNNMANNFVNDFSDKDLMEVWVIDKNGKVVASSSGVSVKDELYPDYDYALANENGIGLWTGRMNSNEKVMALTYMLPENQNGVSGAIRYIVSLEDIDNQLINIYLLVTFSTILLIIIISVSGGFFIKSIILPVRKINEAANQIAKGNFNTTIEKHRYDDEIGQLCDSINNMAYEIGESERIKTEFISTVSHELRTPLTAIKGWGETVKDSSDDREIVNKGLDVIVTESNRLSGLVEELLDFSRMERGKMSISISQIDIVKEIYSVIETFENRSKNEDIKLITDVSSDSIIIDGDSNRLKQALVNIIDNGFKYNKKGGYVKISLTENVNAITVSISDNGCGIPKLDLPKVKEKFYKANYSARGSGIGLAVTEEIIKMHNGEVIIESVVGEGTTVSIVLPKNYKESTN